MDNKTKEGILKYLIEGFEMINAALQFALLHYQNIEIDETYFETERGDKHE